MNGTVNRISLACLLLTVSMTCLAGPIADLGRLAVKDRKVVLKDIPLIEAVVVSDCKSLNNALNTNLSYKDVDLNVNGRTVYVQEPDGSKGLKLVFDSHLYNDLYRYDKVVLNLNGGYLAVNPATGSLTVSKLTPLCVVSRAMGSAQDIPAKEKYISELTDDDIYTMVTLKEMEFAFKDGSIVNIKENYGQYVEKYHKDYKKEINYRMDGAMAMMKDSQGSAIGMAINTLCDWRRDGDGVPQGSGAILGVIVDEDMRRYGNNTGRYKIRPLFREDIQIDFKKKTSSWNMLTGWIRDEFGGKFVDYEKAGSVEQPQVGDRIYSDAGARSLMWTDSGAKTYSTSDWNNIASVRQGAVWNGAIMFDCMSKDWYKWSNIGFAESANSIFLEFSSKKVKPGQVMQLCFEITAGDVNMTNSWGFPSTWMVQYSVDGGEFKTLTEACTGEKAFSLRPLPCWCKKVNTGKYNKNFNTQYDFCLGTQGHVFNIPEDAVGKETVLIKLTPASDRAFSLRSKPSDRCESPTAARITPSFPAKALISIGSIFIDYK